MPFSFTSCHTFKSLNCVSLVSTTPSLFVSYVLKSSKPFVVSLPKSSLWLSILPLLFLSVAIRPSSPFNHPVFSLKPSLSLSKYTLESVRLIVSIPSPSRSNANGVLCLYEVSSIILPPASHHLIGSKLKFELLFKPPLFFITPSARLLIMSTIGIPRGIV